MDEYLVRVRCDKATLFAYVLDVPQRFISYDSHPRVMPREDALEIQARLAPAVSGPVSAFAVSVERFTPSTPDGLA